MSTANTTAAKPAALLQVNWDQRHSGLAMATALAAAGVKLQTHDYFVHLIGIRNTRARDANTFNDVVGALFHVGGVRQFVSFAATTDPGIHYRKNPLMKAGCAVLVKGHYPGAYQLGKHRGIYTALVQTGAKVCVARDGNKNDRLDELQKTEWGFFGINIHRASETVISKLVDKWSAGCQVIANPLEFNVLLALTEIHRQRYGNRFDYTLLEGV